MGVTTYFTVLGVALTLCFGRSEGFKCYVCNSISDRGCGEDNFSILTSKFTTADGCTYCTKVIGSLGATAVQRGCADVCPTFNTNLFGIRAQSTCCSTLLCNGTTNVQATVSLIVALCAAIFLLN